LFFLAGLFFIAFLLSYFVPPRRVLEPQLKSGLTVWQPEEGIIPLSGEWEYMAGMLNTSGWEDASYATLPGTWEGNRFGYGSYRSIIDGIDPAAEYGLLLPYQATAYRLYLDGDLIVSNGTVGINRPSSVPKYFPETFYFIPSKSSAELVLQVSNFHHRRGGPFQTIYFGERQKVERMESGNVVRDWVFVIMFATMSLYQFAFLIVRKHRTGLYLALFFLFVSINGMIGTPEVLIFRIFPDFPWALYQKLCYYVSYITPIWLVLFVSTLYGGVSRKTVAALCLPFVAIALFVTVTPSYIFSVLNEPFQVYTVFIISVVLAMLITAFRKKLPGTKAILLGFVVLIGSMYGGIFFSNNRITNVPFLPLSFLKYYDVSLFSRKCWIGSRCNLRVYYGLKVLFPGYGHFKLHPLVGAFAVELLQHQIDSFA